MNQRDCKNCEKISYRCRHKSQICNLSENDMITVDTLGSYCKQTTSNHLNNCGECEILDSHFIGHYVCDYKLYFRIDNTVSLFSDVIFKYKKLFFKRRQLEIFIKEEQHIKIQYKIKKYWNYFYDPDEEDMDYGLFLYNTKKSNHKAKIMIDAYMNLLGSRLAKPFL